MPKPTVRYQAQLPLRRSYKPGRNTVVRVRPTRPEAPRGGEPEPHDACAPEGAWTLTRTE